jgi:glycosyltransferase involved in cell wall biosynthesis
MYGHRGICWAASGVPQALRQRLKCRVATTFHEFASAAGPHLKDAVLAGVMRWQTGRLLLGSDLAITTCLRYVEYLELSVPRALPVVAIPVGANIEPVPVQPNEIAALRQRYSLDGSKVFGVFGRLSPFRNFPTAIRALELAKQQGLKTYLLLIGCVQASNPRLFDQLQQLARTLGVEAQMVVTGELPAEAVSAHLRLVDVFLFPQCDGVSTRNTTVMSALAHGLPIVTYAPTSGHYDGYRIPYGALVPLGDEKGFIHTAVEFLGRIDDRSEGGNANAEYFEKHFSWSRIAEHYIGAFTAVGSSEYALRCGVRE